MADSIESQEHLMKTIRHLNTAKLELMKATQQEPNRRSWDYVYQQIDNAILNIVKRDRT